MKLKAKLILISTIPIFGMIAIFLLESNLYLQTTGSMEHINELQKDLVSIQSADIELYQAHIATLNAYQSDDLELIKREQELYKSKSGLIKEKVLLAASNFTEEMESQYKTFEYAYGKWNSYNQLIFEKLSSSAVANKKAKEASLDSETAFLQTRRSIDSLVKRIERDLGRNLSTRRRVTLERALLAALKCDKEAYQAYVSQRLAIGDRNFEKVKELDEFNRKSIENVPVLFTRAVNLYGANRLSQTRQTFNENFNNWKGISREVFALIISAYNVNESKNSVLPLIKSNFDTMRTAIETISELEVVRSDLEVETSKEYGVFMSIVAFAISVVLVILTLLLGFLVSRSIMRQIGGEPDKIAKIAESVAAGEFNIEHSEKAPTGILAVLLSMASSLQTAVHSIQKTMSTVSKGDFTNRMDDEQLAGDLVLIGDSINESIAMLSDAIFQVLIVSDQVTEGAGQLAGSAQALATGTTEQAASLEEIGSTMVEIGNRAKTNSNNADQATQLSSQALEIAEKGNSQMKEMLGSMDKINDASNDISKIIKVIDEIAFQTNLLALNAAVEAARAGKYGKGFAVVAEEVRNLAGRSAEAARDTTTLIENSMMEVEHGVDNAAKTAEILDEISGSVRKVNDLVVEITAASLEQRNSAEEMNRAITQVNNVVQQNSSISEQTASTSDQLNSQAAELKALMSSFTLQQTKGKNESPENDMLEYRSERQPTLEAPIEETPQLPKNEEEQPELPYEPGKKSRKMITLDDDSFGKY